MSGRGRNTAQKGGWWAGRAERGGWECSPWLGKVHRGERKEKETPSQKGRKAVRKCKTRREKKKTDEDADTGKGRKGGQAEGREARKKNDMCGGSGGGRKGRRQRVTKGGEMEKTKG